MGIYLDNAATSPLSDGVKEYLISLLDVFGNPSSIHSIGIESKQIIDNTRNIIGNFINANSTDIYFTSSGSAANTLGIKGYYSRNPCKIFYSPIAHKSILKCVESYKSYFPINVKNNGLLDLNDLETKLNNCFNPFVIVDHANSEIGTIQPIKEIIELAHKYNGIVFLDCTGSINSIPIDVTELDVDMMSFSAHKLGGLKNVGVLYKKSSIDLEPLIYGSQEQGLVGGTENVLGIASLGKAILEHDYSKVNTYCRDYIFDYIVDNIPNSYLIGTLNNRLPYNLYVCFKGINGESLLLLLDMNGIYVSTGSACNSKEIKPSSVLKAINMNSDDVHSCIRMTFSGKETEEELDYVCKMLKESVERLRNI